jgi:hypothetical protein
MNRETEPFSYDDTKPYAVAESLDELRGPLTVFWNCLMILRGAGADALTLATTMTGARFIRSSWKRDEKSTSRGT